MAISKHNNAHPLPPRANVRGLRAPLSGMPTPLAIFPREFSQNFRPVRRLAEDLNGRSKTIVTGDHDADSANVFFS